MKKFNTKSTQASSQAIATALEKMIAPERLAEVLSDALCATAVSRNGSVEVDTRSRLQAATLILAYQVGRPIERTESVNVNIDSNTTIDLKERLKRSPALRESLAKLLADAEPLEVNPN